MMCAGPGGGVKGAKGEQVDVQRRVEVPGGRGCKTAMGSGLEGGF